jgi:hypothetical protein
VPDSRSTLEILVDVKNAQQGAADIKSVGQAAKDTGQQAETSGQGFQGMARNLAAAAGGAIAIRKGFQFMRGAAEGAAQLAKDTAALTRTTGMDTQSASAWVSMAKSRGIQTDLLTRSFTAFSKQIRSAEGGSKAAVKAFDDLGISADQLKGMNFDQTLMATADAFQQLPAGADKAAIAQQLFGRQAQALLPLLNLGSDGLREQMEVMKKHGLTLDENGVKKGLELAKAQREMRDTTEGLKMSIGQALVPVLVTASQALLPLIQAFTWGMQNIPGFNYLVLGLAAALAGLLIASTVAGAFSALGISMTVALGPVGLVIIAVAALVAGLVIAYQKVGWFRDGVNAAFNAIKTTVKAVVDFIKAHWKGLATALLVLTGPVGIIVAAFINFKSQIFGVIDAVIGKIKGLVDAVKDVADKVGGALGGIGGAIGGAVGKVLPFAAGGVVPAGGTLALVGEGGPELMQLPGGTRITPLQAGTQEPVDLGGYLGGDLHIHLDVDGRELAYVVARQTDIQKQRR